MFDSLGGQPKFDRLCDQLIPREFGNRAGYIPGPTGTDDGFDAKYIKQEVGKPHTQFKFRQVAGANGEKLRREAVSNFEKWLAEKCSPEDTGAYLYVTNVHRVKLPSSSPERLVKTVNKATKDRIQSVVFTFFDVQALRQEENQSILIYNDAEAELNADAKKALSQYSVSAIPWSAKESLVTSFA